MKKDRELVKQLHIAEEMLLSFLKVVTILIILAILCVAILVYLSIGDTPTLDMIIEIAKLLTQYEFVGFAKQGTCD